jgi:hypothetical protein
MGVETGQYFYAMELIDGETLDDRVHRFPKTLPGKAAVNLDRFFAVRYSRH